MPLSLEESGAKNRRRQRQFPLRGTTVKIASHAQALASAIFPLLLTATPRLVLIGWFSVTTLGVLRVEIIKAMLPGCEIKF